MDKIKTVKIKNPDGSVSQETYTISVDAENVDMLNGKNVQNTIGNIDIDKDGNIAKQLEKVKNYNQDMNAINNQIKNLKDIDEEFRLLDIDSENKTIVELMGNNMILNNTGSSMINDIEFYGDTLVEEENNAFKKNVTGRQLIILKDKNSQNIKNYELNLGKNIFDKNNFEELSNVYIGGAGNYKTTNKGYVIKLDIEPNTTYTVSKEIQQSSNRLRVGISDHEMTIEENFTIWGGGDTAQKVTLTSANNSKYMYIYYRQGNETNRQVILNTLQVEKNNNATEYAEYFPPIELNHVGSYVDKIYKNNNKWYLFPHVLKIDSYNGESISTTYISTTGALTTGATVYYGNPNPTPIEITNSALISQLEEIATLKTYNEKTKISVDGNLPILLKIKAYNNLINGIIAGQKNEIATKESLGLVKIGNGLSIDSNGVLKVNKENESNIPEYFIDNLNSAIPIIKQNMLEVGRRGETFVFITDTHWKNNTKHSPYLIKYILDNTNITEVINGGDFLTREDSVDLGNQELEKAVKAFTSLFGANMYSIFGNHDSNKIGNDSYSNRWLNQKQVYENMYRKQEANITSWNNEAIDSLNPDSQFYYYIDNNATKTRKIFLSSAEQNIGNTQLTWLGNLLTNSIGWNVIIFVHWINFENAYTPDGVLLKTLCDQHTDKVKAIIAGHIHWDLTDHTTAGIPIIYTTTDSLSIGNMSVDKAIRGTISEQAFDVITVNYDTGTVKCVRIGRGVSRTVESNV